MKDGKFVLYVHINKANRKKYVGITSRPVKTRWQNGGGYRHNTHFANAIEKYGWDGFEHIILYHDIDRETACKLERYLIKKFNSQDPEYGYNLTEGGDHAKLSQKALDTLHNREWSEESRRKVADNNPKRREVVCDGIVFPSVRSCGRYYGIGENTLRSYLKGRAATPNEFVAKNLHYADENPNYAKIHKKSHLVICDGIYYQSIAECAKSYDVPKGAMYAWLVERYQMPLKFKEMGLKYVEEDAYIANPQKILNLEKENV